MLWHKAWLETRWRFISALVILTVMAGSNVYRVSRDAAAAAAPQRDDRDHRWPKRPASPA